MKRTLLGYLCIVLLGVSSWPIPAQADGSNPGPTEDEIVSIPEVLVTGISDRSLRAAWFYGTKWIDLLEQLTIQEAFAFSEMAADKIRSLLPDNLAEISDAQIKARQRAAHRSAQNRQMWEDISTWYLADPNRTCNVIALGVGALGATATIIAVKNANAAITVSGVLVTYSSEVLGTLVCNS